MTALPAFAFLAAVAATPAIAAETPDTSERLREAMAACVLPGPGIEARISRLESVGWAPRARSPGIIAAFGDALAISNPPQESDTASWAALRSWARDLAADAPPDNLYGSGRALLQIELQPQTDWPTCLLMTTNSRESDLILQVLAKSGGVVDLGHTRRGEMFSTQFDATGADWRTDVTLHSAAPEQINQLLSKPLLTTLTATFVTQPMR